MSAVNEGMHLAREAQRLNENMRDNLVTGANNNEGAQGGAGIVQLPRKLTAFDHMDDEMNTKMQLMDKTGMTPFGQVYYDDKVGKWLERKAAAVETANLDAWFNREFNKPDLAARQFAQQINPDFYRERERLMMERAQEVLKLKMIQLYGPQSKEDMFRLFLLDTGRVKLPKDWDRIGSDGGQAGDVAAQAVNFKSGLVRLPLFDTVASRTKAGTTLFGNPIAPNTPFYRPASAANDPFGIGTSQAAGLQRPLQQGTDTFADRVVKGLQSQ